MNRCIRCKGKGDCGLVTCPVMARFYAQVKRRPVQNIMAPAPSPFIGSHGYPHVSAGPLLIDDSDCPPEWIRQGYSIDDIVSIRAETIRGISSGNQFLDKIQEVALSSVPIDVEVAFEKPVSYDFSFDGTIAPVGMSGSLTRMSVIENAKVPRPIDKVTSDTDVPAIDAVRELIREGIDVYQIIPLLSTGLLGQGKQRKVVPTRWAITAVDDMAGKKGKKDLINKSWISSIQVLFATGFKNTICCILIPGPWEFEMIEIWDRQSLWAGDTISICVDGEKEKKSGYSPISGAYYSARLAVLEYLTGLGRTATVLVIRYVSNEYWAPLGTWVIREITRKAVAGSCYECSDIPDAVKIASQMLGFSWWYSHSRMLPRIQSQQTLSSFF